jgi:hypothetical protein
MARLARAVFPDLPHHVAQRGNGRQQTFFGDGDYALYRDLLSSMHARPVSRSGGLGADAEMSLRLRKAETIGRVSVTVHSIDPGCEA